MDKYIDKIIELGVLYGPKFVGAIIVLLVGLWVIKALTKASVKLMTKRGVDVTLIAFLKKLINILLKIVLIISVMGMVGIEMTSFIAILGAAGLAIGMALSGTLQNFAGGVMILLFKPFKVGDFLEAQGYKGVVYEIQLFNTLLKTVDNRVVIIPNGGLSTGAMVNYSTMPLRRVDWSFGIGYGDDADKAKDVMFKLIKDDKRILTEPEPFVALSELADSSVNFTVRAWVKGEDYWGVFFDMNEKVYKVFANEGLNIPFPQMDVHVLNN